MSSALESSLGIVAYLALFAAVGVTFLFVNLLVGWLLRPANPNDEKLEIYECGEPSIENSWKRIPISYFKIALVFILFDIELVFIFPWILNLSDPTPGSYFSFITFLIILFIGWIYAYKKGYLEWEM